MWLCNITRDPTIYFYFLAVYCIYVYVAALLFVSYFVFCFLLCHAISQFVYFIDIRFSYHSVCVVRCFCHISSYQFHVFISHNFFTTLSSI